jgi:hypothetical protein
LLIFSCHLNFILVSNSETRIFRPGKEIEGLRGGALPESAANFRCAKVDSFRLPEGRGHKAESQASPKIDAARAEKDRFRMETILACGGICLSTKKRPGIKDTRPFSLQSPPGSPKAA